MLKNLIKTFKIYRDLVWIQTEVYGRVENYFDDVLVRKNGIILTEELTIPNSKL